MKVFFDWWFREPMTKSGFVFTMVSGWTIFLLIGVGYSLLFHDWTYMSAALALGTGLNIFCIIVNIVAMSTYTK